MLRDEGWLLDILLAARRVSTYMEGVSEEEFRKDQMLQDAVVKRLEIIGEAAGQLSPECKGKHPGLPWPLIVGMRNRLIHEYFNVDLAVVWETARNDIPKLIDQIEPLVPPEEA